MINTFKSCTSWVKLIRLGPRRLLPLTRSLGSSDKAGSETLRHYIYKNKKKSLRRKTDYSLYNLLIKSISGPYMYMAQLISSSDGCH